MSQHETIRLARRGLNMSQAALAEAAGLSERTVKRAEAGHPLSPETAQALSSVLRLAPGALSVGPGGEPTQPPSRAALPLVETALSAEALEGDPRARVIQDLLRPGSPYDAIIIPDPELRGRHARPTPADERRGRTLPIFLILMALCSFLAIPLVLLAWHLPSLSTGERAFGWICAAFGFLCVWFIASMFRPGIVGSEVRDAFARQGLLLVERGLLHVVWVGKDSVSRETYDVATAGMTWTSAGDGAEPRSAVRIRNCSFLIAGLPVGSTLERRAGFA